MTLPKPGDELKLRNGWPAKVLAVHPEQDRAIFVEYLAPNGVWDPGTRLANGRTFKDYESGLDLMLPKPEPKRLRGWVNVYRSGQRAWFDSKEMADSHSCAAFRTECLYIDLPLRGRRRAMTLELGTPVWRKGKAYSGPGIIRGYAYSEDCTTVTHYIVAYNILGGEGQLLHIHTPNELTVFTRTGYDT